MRRRHFFPGALLVAGTILCGTVSERVEAQSRAISTDELVRASEIVARGKVREMKAEWDESRSRIRTRITLSVDEYLKGGGGGTMELFVPGGEIGPVGEVYSHVARFARDEDVVVFAHKDGKGRYRVSGGSQGKYTVTQDERSGKRIVAHYWPLDDFRARIRKAENPSGRPR